MWEAAAYSQNVFKVMLDPATWLATVVFIFWVKRFALSARVALALAVNGLFILVWIVWPTGESGRSYAWTAFFHELAATAIWCAIFIGARRLFGRRGVARAVPPLW